MGPRPPGLKSFARIGAAILYLGLPGAAARGAELAPAPEDVDAREIAQRAEKLFRGDSRYLEASMTIASPDLARPRTLRLRSWDDRLRRRSFIRILAPGREAGMAFLKLHPNLWMYLPRAQRTVRIQSSAMLRSWMGSDFNYADLVNQSGEIAHYHHRLLGYDPYPGGRGGAGAWVVEYLPHADAPIVWDRIVAWIDKELATPLRREYFGAGGEKLRVLRFDDLRTVQGRRFPYRWEMRSLEAKGHETVIEIHSVRFDEPIDESVFSTRNLKRAE